MSQSNAALAAALAAGLFAASGAQAVSLVAVTTDNRLTKFDSATPSMLSPFVAITGVTAGARIVGIDTRPGDNKVYGVGTDNKLYTIDTLTGSASVHSTLTGPGTTRQISRINSSNFIFSLAQSEGFVVTPSRIPQPAISRISSRLAVSRKNFIMFSFLLR